MFESGRAEYLFITSERMFETSGHSERGEFPADRTWPIYHDGMG